MFLTVYRTDGTGEIGTQRGTLLTSLQSILVQAEQIQVKSWPSPSQCDIITQDHAHMTISVFNGKAASLCASYLRVMANMLFALGFHAHPLARGGSIAITLLLSNYHGKTTPQLLKRKVRLVSVFMQWVITKLICMIPHRCCYKSFTLLHRSHLRGTNIYLTTLEHIMYWTIYPLRWANVVF